MDGDDGIEICLHADEQETGEEQPMIEIVIENDQLLQQKREENFKSKSVQCEICNKVLSKYSCPACSIRTCSLECVKKHKEVSSCTGVKAKSEFVPISGFTDDIILRDYFFLKDGERLAGDAFFEKKNLEKKRKKQQNNDNKSKKRKENEDKTEQVNNAEVMNNNNDNNGGVDDSNMNEENENQTKVINNENNEDGKSGLELQTPTPQTQNLPVSLKKLVNEAKNREVNLLIMPFGMTKRNVNSSYFDYKKKTLSWRIEWIFYHHQSQHNNNNNEEPVIQQYSFVNERIDDSTVLMNILLENLDKCKEMHAKEVIQYYNYDDKAKLELLMKVADCPSNQIQYYQLNKFDTLRAALAHKTIIEFPTFIVCFPHQLSSYSLSW